MKMFVIPCEVNGQKVPVQYYIGEPTKFLRSPIHFQRAWIKQERGVDVPADVCDSLEKLKDIADLNNVVFVDLCTHALNYRGDQVAQIDDPTRRRKLLEEIRLGLVKADLRFSEENESGNFLLYWRTDFGDLNLYLRLRVVGGTERIMAISMSLAQVPEERRPAVCEFINRVNYSISYGNFEMNTADGQLIFRTSLQCDQPEAFVGQRWLSTLIWTNYHETVRHLPAFHALISESVSLEDAMAKIQSPAG